MEQYLIVEGNVSRGLVFHVRGFRSIDRMVQVDGTVAKFYIRQNIADPAMHTVGISVGYQMQPPSEKDVRLGYLDIPADGFCTVWYRAEEYGHIVVNPA